MTVYEAINLLLDNKELGQQDLAEMLGRKQSSISRSIRGNMRVDNLIKLLEALDCQLVIQDGLEPIGLEAGGGEHGRKEGWG